MRFRFIHIKDGKRRCNWAFLALFVVLTYVLVVAAAELYWFGMTGGLSRLIGGYAFVAATLIVIRVVGSGLLVPEDLTAPRGRRSSAARRQGSSSTGTVSSLAIRRGGARTRAGFGGIEDKVRSAARWTIWVVE